MPLTVLPFPIEDYEEIFSLWRQSEGLGLSEADSKEPLDRFLLQNPGTSFVARLDGRIVGTILTGHDGRRGYVYHVAVHRDYRRLGVERRLVERALKALHEAGISKCHLFVFPDNPGGMVFWKSLGWEERTDLKVFSRILDEEGERSRFHRP